MIFINEFEMQPKILKYFRPMTSLRYIKSLSWLLTASVLIFLLQDCSSSKSTAVEADTSEIKVEDATEVAFQDRGDIRYVFYNVENLFDTYDDTNKIDEEFLPWGMKAWKTERYDDKLRKIFKVMVNVSGWELPELIGLCEIENRFVLQELINKTPLSREEYGIIHEESPDARGIDLGFLYRKDKFIPLDHEAIRINFPFDTIYKTRDLLRIEGLVNKKDTVHFFICHFPSRRGGEVASEPKRMYVASQVRAKVDSIMAAQPGARIIVTGDFNDEPSNKSISEVLQAKGDWENLEEGQLYNYMHPFQTKEGKGTYKYQGYWNMLDQFMITQSMMDPSNNVHAKRNSAQIFQKSWLMQDDDDAPGMKPYRTYGGSYYYGGYSDHLPIYLDLFFND